MMFDPKELFGNDYSEFREIDPYNLHNEVVGFISRKPNEYYGAIIITEVRGEKVQPQLIMGTPKIHYPFASRADGTRNYLFPTVRDIEIYEKLDGTNILAYYYDDAKGQRYITYKTRLRPFVGVSQYGDFLGMWEAVGRPWEYQFKGLMHDNNCNLSFELWGARNPHLVIYDEPLAISLLFGVSNTGRILSPTDMGLASRKDYRQITSIPLIKRLGVIDKDYVFNYEQTQQNLEEGLSQLDEYTYKGIEGAVWYLHFPDGRCVQVKCKPETIETIHMAAGAGIGKNVVIATCWNALENVDTLTLEFVEQLLSEEFEQNKVEASRPLINRCMEFVTEQAEFRARVLEEYRKLGTSIVLEKAETMRALSQVFPKKDMRKVHGIISAYA